MSEAWNRDSFRPGGGDYGLLEEMQAQEAAQKEKGETEKEGGQGVASFNANPKPGDELYDTLHQARAEATQHNQLAQQPQHQAAAVSDESALAFAALIAASGQQQGQGPQQQPEPTPYQAAQQEAGQPDAERPQPATFHALRAEQAAATPQPGAQQPETSPANEGPTRPGDRQQDGLMSDFVSDDVRQTTEAAWTQQQQQQRNRTMGLTM